MKKVEFRFLDSEYLVTSEGIASWQNKVPLKDIRMSRWGREEAVLTAWSSGVVPPTTVQSCCRRMAFCALVGQGCGWYPWQKENATSVLQLVTRKSIVGVLSTEIVIAGIRWLDVRLLSHYPICASRNLPANHKAGRKGCGPYKSLCVR